MFELTPATVNNIFDCPWQKLNEKWYGTINLYSPYFPVMLFDDMDRKLTLLQLLTISCKINGIPIEFTIPAEEGMFKEGAYRSALNCNGSIKKDDTDYFLHISFSGTTMPPRANKLFLSFRMVCNAVVEITEVSCSLQFVFNGPDDEISFVVITGLNSMDKPPLPKVVIRSEGL